MWLTVTLPDPGRRAPGWVPERARSRGECTLSGQGVIPELLHPITRRWVLLAAFVKAISVLSSPLIVFLLVHT
jgi:hypothetical protein